MTSEELDRKIAEIAAVREANDGWEEHHSAIADIYPNLVADRERLKARVAELEAWIKATGRGMPPKHGIDMNWPEPKPQPNTLVDTTTFPRPESDE